MRYKVNIYFDSGESHGWVVDSSTILDAVITFRSEYIKIGGQKMWRPYAQAIKMDIEVTQFGLYEKQED